MTDDEQEGEVALVQTDIFVLIAFGQGGERATGRWRTLLGSGEIKKFVNPVRCFKFKIYPKKTIFINQNNILQILWSTLSF